MIILTLKEQPTVPLEAEVALARRDRRPGPRAACAPCRCSWASGSAAWTTSSTSRATGSDELEIRGDAGQVKWIGRGMTRGRITIAATPACTWAPT